MKSIILFLSLVMAVPALAQLPFLFTPHVREIQQHGSSYTVQLTNGEKMTIDRFGMNYRATVAGREVATYQLQGSDWVESPNGRTWTLHPDGKWRSAKDGWTLARVIKDIVLRQGDASMAWRQDGANWIRK